MRATMTSLTLHHAAGIILLFLSSAAAAASGGFPAKLTVERAVPAGARMEDLRTRDAARHGRILKSSSNGSVEFAVEGSANPFTVGLYYTRLKLGNPSKEFYVQIDTGSDIFWVTCKPCKGCPTTSGLNIQLEFFEPSKSTTSQQISCSDSRCDIAAQAGQSTCTFSAFSSNLCSYSFEFGDGSGTAGYYVSDTFYFDTLMDNEQTGNSSATVVFGCSNSQSGQLTESDRAVDGIIGFGHNGLSIISQFASIGVAPKVFSHCLKGSGDGGGVFVLGEIIEPGIVYTPLVQSQPHYNLNLESIAVNGQTLSINPLVFSTSSTQGTIVDTGTTLTYLTEEAYNPFINAIIASLSSSVQTVLANGNKCFITTSSIDESFPSVTLNFMGNASMKLKPQDYLLNQGSVGDKIIWCIGWQMGQGNTILGDLVLKDKIFVYDLEKQRVGWTDYDCSLSVNVSTSSGTNEFLNTGQLSVSGLSHSAYCKLLPTGIAFVLVHIFVFAMLRE